MIPKSFIDEVNTLVDLAQLIGERIPELKKKSGSEFIALCPFHNEETPSFTVSNSKNFYHCHGCGAHGNAINFIIEYEGKSFIEALKEVANLVGMAVPEDNPERMPIDKHEQARYMRACAVLTAAQSVYVEKLKLNPIAEAYLTGRGLTVETIGKFGIGYAPDAWDTITSSRSYTREALLDAGIAMPKEGVRRLYDRFRDRVTFPIYGKPDKQNKVRIIGFGGRAIRDDQDPKYLNSPACLLFSKGDNLYGIKQALESIRHSKRVIVVEGYMDVVMLSQYGIENVVASLGTSITDAQIRKLFKLAPAITFCMDGDDAGRKAAWRVAENIISHLNEEHRIDFMFMPDDQDPDEFVRTNGKVGFNQNASLARTLTDYILDELLKQTDMQNGESLACYLTTANNIAKKINAGVIKLSFQKRIAELAGISLDTMLEMLKANTDKALNKTVVPSPMQPAAQIVPPPSPTPSTALSEISIAAKMLGLAVLHTKSIADGLGTQHLSKFLSTADREMLFPLLAYLKANSTATKESVSASLSFNPHIVLITALANSASLLGEQFDAINEVQLTLERFAAMEQVWGVINEHKKLGLTSSPH